MEQASLADLLLLVLVIRMMMMCGGGGGAAAAAAAAVPGSPCMGGEGRSGAEPVEGGRKRQQALVERKGDPHLRGGADTLAAGTQRKERDGGEGEGMRCEACEAGKGSLLIWVRTEGLTENWLAERQWRGRQQAFPEGWCDARVV